MAVLAIRTIIQAPTVPCTQRTHISNLGSLQVQENRTSTAPPALMERISGRPHCRIRLGDRAVYSIALLSRDGQICVSVIQTIWSPQGLPRESPFRTP
jgi:hypothetical protein